MASEHIHYHNDYRIRWQNYRSFQDTGWVTIKPLTVLIGPNNAGKTSVVSPLLIMNQTIVSRDKSTPLITRGPLFDAGNFRDVLHKHKMDAELKLAFEFHTHDYEKDDPEVRPIGSYAPGGFQAAFAVSGEEPTASLLTSYEVVDIFRRSYFKRSLGKSSYGLTGHISKAAMKSVERSAISRQKPTNFLFSPSPALFDIASPNRANESTDAEQFSAVFSDYLRALGYSYQVVIEIMRALSYIGPLRERPRRYYEASGEIPLTVGPRGQKTASILRTRYGELESDLNIWAEKFGLADKVRLNLHGDDVFSIMLCKDGYETNLADSGFGASQVLPLIVQSLVAPKASLTIAEQPEIHLNPRLQGTLAELFVEMATNDRRIVVETHSEHLLMAVRRLIADEKISSDRVAVYFVERRNGESTIREIPLTDDGAIYPGAWPKGFFDDALSESMALAKAQSSRARHSH